MAHIHYGGTMYRGNTAIVAGYHYAERFGITGVDIACLLRIAPQALECLRAAPDHDR